MRIRKKKEYWGYRGEKWIYWYYMESEWVRGREGKDFYEGKILLLRF